MPDYDELVSRRDVISMTGAAGAAALAGCSGGDGSDGDGAVDPDQEVPDHADAYFRTADGEHQVTDFQYNPHQWAGWVQITNALYAEWTQYLISEDEYYPHAVEDWEFGERSATLHLSEEFTWDNGEDITADDFVMQLELGEPMDDNLYDFVDDIEAADDYTIELSYPEGTNTDIIKHVTLNRDLDHPPADWADIHEDYKNGEDVLDAMFDNEIDEPTASGPLELAESDTQRALYDVRDDHHLADNFNWNGYQVEHRTGNDAFHQSFATQELDGVPSLFAGPGALSQFPGTLEQIKIPGGFGMGYVFNHDHEHYGDREVRQAFAYAIDTPSAIESVGSDTKLEFPAQAGLTVPATRDWLDPDEYEDYAQDLDRVEELLQSAGFERNSDDVWERDGSELEAELIVPGGWSDWVTPTSTVVDQLSAAGFAAQLKTEDSGVCEDTLATGDFAVAAYGHTEGGNAAMNHPYFSFSWKFENRDHATPNFFNYPEDEAITVPDGDGGEISVNPRDEISTIAGTNDDDEIQQSVDRLARLFTEDLPIFLFSEKYEQSFIDRDGWQFPRQEESDHFQAFWPLYWLAKQDQLKATVAAEE